MCGPSGGLHISRYYELISHTVEHWFESTLEMSFNELHVVRNLGIPTVQMETRCSAFPRSGDTISMALRPISVGSSAVQLRTWLASSGKILLETRQVIVFVELNDEKIRTVRIPDMLKQRMSSQLAPARTE
jgi:acyl-CoA thioesterase FadM